MVLLPLRDRLRGWVDRFLYGKRSDPVRAFADLGAVVASGSITDLLEAALAEVAEAFHSPGARVIDVRGTTVAHAGTMSHGVAAHVDLIVAGAALGALELGARRPRERFSRRDTTMVRTLAGPVALALQATSLADELASERDAVIGAAGAARAKLRDELHDGLGPSLTGLRLGLQALQDALSTSDAGRAEDIVAVLGKESDRAVAEVRRVIENLRPYELKDAGVADALRRRFGSAITDVTVSVRSAPLPDVPAPIEDAIYHVVTEAVTNARRHSGAGKVTIELAAVAGRLEASVTDDGRGLAPDAQHGVGLTSMRLRTAAVGGELLIESDSNGTRVVARLPLPVAAEPAEAR